MHMLVRELWDSTILFLLIFNLHFVNQFLSSLFSLLTTVKVHDNQFLQPLAAHLSFYYLHSLFEAFFISAPNGCTFAFLPSSLAILSNLSTYFYCTRVAYPHYTYKPFQSTSVRLVLLLSPNKIKLFGGNHLCKTTFKFSKTKTLAQSVSSKRTINLGGY